MNLKLNLADKNIYGDMKVCRIEQWQLTSEPTSNIATFYSDSELTVVINATNSAYQTIIDKFDSGFKSCYLEVGPNPSYTCTFCDTTEASSKGYTEGQDLYTNPLANGDSKGMDKETVVQTVQRVHAYEVVETL